MQGNHTTHAYGLFKTSTPKDRNNLVCGVESLDESSEFYAWSPDTQNDEDSSVAAWTPDLKLHDEFKDYSSMSSSSITAWTPQASSTCSSSVLAWTPEFSSQKSCSTCTPGSIVAWTPEATPSTTRGRSNEAMKPKRISFSTITSEKEDSHSLDHSASTITGKLNITITISLLLGTEWLCHKVGMLDSYIYMSSLMHICTCKAGV